MSLAGAIIESRPDVESVNVLIQERLLFAIEHIGQVAALIGAHRLRIQPIVAGGIALIAGVTVLFPFSTASYNT